MANARQNRANDARVAPARGNSGVRYTDSTAKVAGEITRPTPVWQTGKPEFRGGNNIGSRSSMCKGCAK